MCSFLYYNDFSTSSFLLISFHFWIERHRSIRSLKYPTEKMKIFRNVAICSFLASAQTTTTVTSTTATTTTTEYYDRYTTYSTGTTTLTTSSADSTSCAMFHNDLDSFFSKVRNKCQLFPLHSMYT